MNPFDFLAWLLLAFVKWLAECLMALREAVGQELQAWADGMGEALGHVADELLTGIAVASACLGLIVIGIVSFVIARLRTAGR